MNDEQYRDYSLELLERFNALLTSEVQHSSAEDPIRELATAFATLQDDPELYSRGPELVTRLFSSCPLLAPRFPRDLLWFLGGDCLHLMPDEEIDGYQQLEEQRLEAASRGKLMDYQEMRAKLLKLQ
jgi:hypothetical protein